MKYFTGFGADVTEYVAGLELKVKELETEVSLLKGELKGELKKAERQKKKATD